MRLSPFTCACTLNPAIPDRAILGTARTRRGVLSHLDGYGLLEITWQDLRRLNAVAAPVRASQPSCSLRVSTLSPKEVSHADPGLETSQEVT